jgi:hypothetical protein
MAEKTVRIGGASAFYGDSQLAARQLVDSGDVDYLVFDYLAEVTMAILARAHMRDASLGYAVDFVTVAMKDVLADCARKGIKVVANAGGVNVPGCITALEALCVEQGLNLKIAGVYGDNLSPRTAELAARGMPDMDDGKPLPEKLASVNAYLGAKPIADVLAAGADVVVTGRIVDSAVVLGPLIHEFDWPMDDYDRLAQGSLAGHVLECGAQCAGGNFTDWHLVPDYSNIGYPVADITDDGSFVVGIPPNTGGLVTRATVAEQILYEIGDPANYLLPDVACDFTSVELTDVGTNQVRVSGARGRAPGPDYKVCATYIDGYRLMGCFFMAGPRCADKARTAADAWVKRVRRVFKERGIEDFRQVSIEVIGAEHVYGPHAQAGDTREVMCKFGLHHNDARALTFAAAEMAYLGTSGTPGMSGLGGGRSKPQPLMRVHSTLIAKEDVPVILQVADQVHEASIYAGSDSSAVTVCPSMPVLGIEPAEDWVEVPLEKIAYARSGDKGNKANIGLMARDPKYLDIIETQVTSDVVAAYFSHIVFGQVTRFAVPGFGAYNFLMTEALGGGATGGVRIDGQGKAYGQMLLSLMVKVPADWHL